MTLLYQSPSFQKQCIDFLGITNQSFRKVLIAYSKIKFGGLDLFFLIQVRLRDIIDPNDKTFNHRSFITFGLLHKIIQRCHGYPVLSNTDKYKELPSILKNMFNGNNSIDAICCEINCTKSELRKVLKQISGDCKLIYK
jgi:hypothetical protein